MEDLVMDRFDFSPLFRSTIGFDRLARLVDSATRVDTTPTYPPYNIESTGDDSYRLTMAVAGFSREEIDVTVEKNSLVISGKAQKEDEAAQGRYLHRGIARRAFERRFSLADHIKVNGASMDNGLLHVDLVREVPEEAKPRQIKIGEAISQPQVTEQKEAA
jgi:molecular chaperone IbpA